MSGSEEDEEDEEDASEAEQDLSDAEATEPKQKPDGSDPVPSGSGSSISGTSKKTVTVESKGKNKGGKATSSPPKATANSEATRAKEQDAQRMRDLSYTNQQPNNCTSLKDAVFFCSNTSSEAKVKFCLISMKRHVEKKYTEDSTGGTPEEQALTTTLKKELSKVQDQLNSKEKFLTRKLKELCELTAANRSGGDHVLAFEQRDLVELWMRCHQRRARCHAKDAETVRGDRLDASPTPNSARGTRLGIFRRGNDPRPSFMAMFLLDSPPASRKAHRPSVPWRCPGRRDVLLLPSRVRCWNDPLV